jgi:nitrite reductase (cytochrome c-552)
MNQKSLCLLGSTLLGALFVVSSALAAPATVKPSGSKVPVTKTAKKPMAPPAVTITDETEDPAIWGQLYPGEYATYLKTVDTTRTKFGGSEALPRTPTATNPLSVISQSKIEEDTRLKTMWAGYAFALDFREDRGHAYMLSDQLGTKRVTERKQPGACLNCHASTYVAFLKAGEGDVVKGFEKLNPMPYEEASKLVKHPVACIDCHDPSTLMLRITKPAFLEGIKVLKASQGVANYDVNKQASQAEMRAYVCAQCHVEYYFKGAEKRLVFPWAKGVKAEEIASYYDEVKFVDWRHAKTGAAALKAQHPEFEMWTQGVHARSGVSCVDCHMPEITFKGETITDHHVNSPVLKLEVACVKCHKWPATELRARVELIQDRHMQLRNVAFDALIALINDLEAAVKAGRPDGELATARTLQRRAQFLFDFVEAENSVGFHAPQEASRLLGNAADLARQGQLALRDPAFKPTLALAEVAAPVK